MVINRLATSGNDGVLRYRFPAIARLASRTLLMAYESCPARETGENPYRMQDLPILRAQKTYRCDPACPEDPFAAPYPNTIHFMRSRDAGLSWEPLAPLGKGTDCPPTPTAPTDTANIAEVRASAPNNHPTGFHHPSFLVDFVTGRLFCFYTKSYRAGIRDSRPGSDPKDLDIIHQCIAWSDDEGESWIHADLTSQVDGAHGWSAHFNPTGHGIQLHQGPSQGRLIQPGLIVDVDGETRALAICSDDHGRTWWASNPVGQGVTEASVTELSDGRIILKARRPGSNDCFTAFSLNSGRYFNAMSREENASYSTCYATMERGFPCAQPGSAQSSVLIYADQKEIEGQLQSVLMVSNDDGFTVRQAGVFTAQAFGTVDVVAMPDQALCAVAYEDEAGVCVQVITFEDLGLFDLARGWNAKVEDQLALMEDVRRNTGRLQ